MNTKLISMFHSALKEPGAEKNFAKVNEVAMKYGYIIHPECCTKDVAAWLKEQSFNPNATFYKEWEDITSKTRFELLVDQILHYATTYGTDFALGNGYVPNDEPVVIPYEHFKVITPATKEEIFDRCMDMLKSGIALKSDTINVLVEYFVDYDFTDKVNLDEVKNKEAQAVLSDLLEKLPSDEFGMLRCIVYKYTGSAMLIKDKKTLYTISGKNGYQYSQTGKFDLSVLSDQQMKVLSRIFYRYKPIFLAMKGGKNSAVINKIRKYANVYHKPLKKGFWEICLTSECQQQPTTALAEAEKEVGSLNNFRKVQLMQSIKERLLCKDNVGKMFIIRNGNMFIREDYKATCDVKYFVRLYNILENSLVESLKTKATNVFLPKGVELSCPTSEKNFIGNYPFGSYVPMNSNHNVFGIYWRNEWGARDLDLWYTDKNGNQYGWSSRYTDGKTVIFSGDMTNAEPEATELFYLGKEVTEGNIGVNVFYAYKAPKFKLFVANENCKNNLKCGHMCDPNNIVFEAEINFDQPDGLKKVGIICNKKLVLADLRAGNQRVSTSTAADIVNRQMKFKAESYVDLKPILKKAGFTINPTKVDEESGETISLTPNDIECLDFTNPSKDDLIKLFA